MLIHWFGLPWFGFYFGLVLPWFLPWFYVGLYIGFTYIEYIIVAKVHERTAKLLWHVQPKLYIKWENFAKSMPCFCYMSELLCTSPRFYQSILAWILCLLLYVQHKHLVFSSNCWLYNHYKVYYTVYKRIVLIQYLLYYQYCELSCVRIVNYPYCELSVGRSPISHIRRPTCRDVSNTTSMQTNRSAYHQYYMYADSQHIQTDGLNQQL